VTARDVIIGGAYATWGIYAQPLDFVDYALDEQDARAPGTDAETVIAKTTERLRKRADEGALTNAAAKDLLAARALDAAGRTIERYVDDDELGEDILRERFSALLDQCRELGLEVQHTALFFVDDYPAPYDSLQGWAMNLDVSDQRAFGIEPGIRLKRQFLVPLYSSFLMAHELTHALCGQVDSDRLARGLEEGLADLVGSLYLGRTILDASVCETMLLNSRAAYPQSQFWQGYSSALRLAITIHQTMGIEGLLDILRQGNQEGREAIVRAEMQWLQGGENSRPGQADLDDGLARFGRRFLGLPTHLVVSPLAYVLAEHLELGQTVREVCSAHNIAPDAGEKAARELHERVFLVMLDGDKIVADETKPLLKANMLRAEITATS
jgi:hypothetical protein